MYTNDDDEEEDDDDDDDIYSSVLKIPIDE